MKRAELDNLLQETEHIKIRNWGKIISISKRQYDTWVIKELSSHGYDDFTLSHLPLIMNIKPEGTNNNELASIAKISKQAMSKVVKDLLEKEYIETNIDDNDKRSTIIALTDKGKRFVIKARYCVRDLMEVYKNLLGKKEYEQMINSLTKIMDYNEKHHIVI